MEDHTRDSSSENLPSKSINATSTNSPCKFKNSLCRPSSPQISSTKRKKIEMPSTFVCLHPPISQAPSSTISETSHKTPLYNEESIAKNNVSPKDKVSHSAPKKKITIPSVFLCLFPPISQI
ncbi:hypothetical protein HNY73_014585 [Argiope bruennichi]|nr:hypothetical protein HNY73_014585 [Argiope bruennichi]